MARTKKNGKKRLVIVESPAKARTLAGILGPEYDIRASVGHVRDLPKSKLGVDTEHGFAPQYLIPKDKKDIVKEIRNAASSADEIYLATDPDREGEAISWHLLEATELTDRPHQRVVFHEITPEAVREAFEHPRPIDYRLVDAQQARRVLDRLVGYRISPVLWKKIRRGLSAGRVQSVALRMVVEREREITAFVPQEYWTIDADLAKAPANGASDAQQTFATRLHGFVGKKKIEIPDGTESERLAGLLRSASYSVADLKKRPQLRRPGPPFTTSTLQQDASRRFGFTAKRTMAVAQQLYEGLDLPGQGQVGLITYMRTDSTNIAESAKSEVRDYIKQRYGADFLPDAPRTFRTKGKRAQEAHEAIRPTSAERAPSSLQTALSRDQLRLYTLIWQRFVACQMAEAVFDLTTIEVDAQPADGSDALRLRATESVLRFAGYRQVYEEQRDEDDKGDDEPEARGLPELAPADALRQVAIKPEQHFTEPPPRYSEASLVKALEENGIGRPSTYAPILSTIQDRGYVERDGRALVPQELGFVVNDLLIEHFPDVFSVGFTAEMEEELDEVARGERPWPPVVQQFYDPLEAALEAAAAAPRVEEETDETCEKCGKPMIKRWGRFGQFLACTGFPECKSTRPI
ncbi:MAG: type I DNA topoisomerase, partial [Dehalococcoidia bacterium]